MSAARMTHPNNRATMVSDGQARAALVALISTLERRWGPEKTPALLTALRTDIRMGEVRISGLVEEVARTATYELGYEAGLLGTDKPADTPPSWNVGYLHARRVKGARLNPPSSRARVDHANVLTTAYGSCHKHPGEELQHVGPGLWECPECGQTYTIERIN